MEWTDVAKMQEHGEIRLNKFLAERLGISRREADDLIAEGKVTLNGKKAELGSRVKTSDQVEIVKNKHFPIDKNSNVCYNGSMRVVSHALNHVYLALNKPVGYVCSRKQQGDAQTIYALLPVKYHKLKTVGRLDKDSSGLILLTSDGDFAFKMTHPSFAKFKEYNVELDKPLEPLHQQMIADFGIEIGDGVSKLGLERVGTTRKKWIVTMSEGRNRQIRRTFAALGYTVIKLHRTKFGNYNLSGLPSGEFVEISAA